MIREGLLPIIVYLSRNTHALQYYLCELLFAVTSINEILTEISYGVETNFH